MHDVFRREPGQPPYVLGHRGVRGTAPENTMKAFFRAASEGADGIELDVRLCQGGDVVVCHDPTLTRLTNGRDERAVADLTLTELAQVDVGEGEAIPTLREVLRWLEGQTRCVRVNVELKRDVPNRRAAVRAVAELLSRWPALCDRVIVSSFDPWMLAHLGWLLPRVARGFLFEEGSVLRSSGWAALPLFAEAVHPSRALVSPERVRAWKNHGKWVNVWTVNHESEARSLADMGVDALITDRPRAIADAIR